MATCQDPQLTYLNGLGYNVLAEAQAGFAPLEVLGQDGNGVADLGPLTAVWNTSASAPGIQPPQSASSISGQQTSNLSASIGVNILANVIAAFGGQAPQITASYTNAKTVQFTLVNVQVVSVVLTDVGAYLETGDLNSANPVIAQYFQNNSCRAYLVHEILQSNSVSVSATSQSGGGLQLDAPTIAQAIGGNIGVTPSSQDASTLTFSGAQPITFAFKAMEIGFSNGQWQLLGDQVSQQLSMGTSTGQGVPALLQPIANAGSGLLHLITHL